MSEERPILLVDGMNLFIRAYAADPTVTSSGQPVGGALGFLKSIRLATEKIMPTDVYVVWEGGGAVRKRALYPEYKANRKPVRLNRFDDDESFDSGENRNWQISFLIKMLNKIPICQVYGSECEADDVIGYMCRYKLRDKKKVILSSDKDFYQLIDENTRMFSPIRKAFVTYDDVVDQFDISPENFCVAKAICGDDSDNIPGIKGAGFKTVAKRFPQLKESQIVTVEEVISEAAELSEKSPNVKILEKISKSKDIIQRNWKLMFLDLEMLSASQIKPINDMIDNFEPSRDKIGLMKLLANEGLNRFNIDKFFFTLSCITSGR